MAHMLTSIARPKTRVLKNSLLLLKHVLENQHSKKVLLSIEYAIKHNHATNCIAFVCLCINKQH